MTICNAHDFWVTVSVGDIVATYDGLSVEVLEIPDGETFCGVSIGNSPDWSCFWLKSKFTSKSRQ